MLPMLQHLTIDPALVVTNPLWQAPSMADLHINLVHYPILVLRVNIKADTPAEFGFLNGFLNRWKFNPLNLQFG